MTSSHRTTDRTRISKREVDQYVGPSDVTVRELLAAERRASRKGDHRRAWLYAQAAVRRYLRQLEDARAS